MTEHANGHTNGVSPNGNGQGDGHAPSALLFPSIRNGLQSGVVAKLREPLDPKLVSRRQGRGGRQMAYLEGHTVIDQANRIFGFDGWGHSIVGEVACREISSFDAKTGEVRRSAMYCATVRVEVPGAPSRTDVGCQPVTDETPDGHETAYKGAVTDALKRALRSFGSQLGNGLYGDGTPAARPADGRGPQRGQRTSHPQPSEPMRSPPREPATREVRRPQPRASLNRSRNGGTMAK